MDLATREGDHLWAAAQEGYKAAEDRKWEAGQVDLEPDMDRKCQDRQKTLILLNISRKPTSS